MGIERWGRAMETSERQAGAGHGQCKQPDEGSKSEEGQAAGGSGLRTRRAGRGGIESASRRGGSAWAGKAGGSGPSQRMKQETGGGRSWRRDRQLGMEEGGWGWPCKSLSVAPLPDGQQWSLG